MSRFIGPYVNTVLSTLIALEPHQMNNDIYKNIKSNLVSDLEGKCFKQYGFISKIYEIIEYSDGYIIPENPKAAATFDVKFSCKICYPLKKSQLVCKLERSNKLMLKLNNGPINVIVTMDRVNKSVFFQDPKTGILMAKQESGKSIQIVSEVYLKVSVEYRTFDDRSDNIMVIGYLDDLATDEEVEKSFKQEFGKDKIINFDKYVEQEEKGLVIIDETESDEGDERESETGENSDAEEESEGEEEST